jgi:hypothetical protein
MVSRSDRAHPARSPLSHAVSDGVDDENQNPHFAPELNRIPDSNEANQMSWPAVQYERSEPQNARSRLATKA